MEEEINPRHDNQSPQISNQVNLTPTLSEMANSKDSIKYVLN